MAYISFQPQDYFNTVLWTTDGTGNKALTTGHSTDMVWIKFRDYAYDHRIYDDVRGVTKKIIPNKTDAESTTTDLASFDTNGFTVGSNLNSSGEGGLVGWSWKANGSGSSNTDGSITSTVSANTTSGFSIVKYTGTGSNATIGTGLGAIPHMAIFKRTDTSGFNWFVYHRSLGAGKFIILDTTGAEQSSTSIWQNTTPTSSVITLGGDGGVNASGGTYVCYAFAEKKGFSKFGSYSANNNADGPMIYTGFSPAFVIIKSSNDTRDWCILDNKRPGYNVVNKDLRANETDVESTQDRVDFLSNGFKLRNASGAYNSTGNTYIYMAFAEAPLVGSNNIPATAR